MASESPPGADSDPAAESARPAFLAVCRALAAGNQTLPKSLKQSLNRSNQFAIFTDPS